MARTYSKRLNVTMMFAFRNAVAAGSIAAGKQEGSRGGPERETTALPERRYAVKIAATERLVRAEVLKDLSMLVNTVALESTVDLTDFPHVRSSILNFGVPDIASRTLEEHRVDAIATELECALKSFEPRLVADTIEVRRDQAPGAADLTLRFVVRSDLMCNPVNVPVEFIADLEIDSRKIVIERL